jgi:hypothetical protein
MKKELNYLASKKEGIKLGVKNCAQLPINKKSTPSVQSSCLRLILKFYLEKREQD